MRKDRLQKLLTKLWDLASEKEVEYQKKKSSTAPGREYAVTATTLPRQYHSFKNAGDNFTTGPKLHSQRVNGGWIQFFCKLDFRHP